MNATVGLLSSVESVVWGCECYSRTTASVESVVWGCECYSRTTASVESVVWGCECYSRTTASVESVVWGCECSRNPTVLSCELQYDYCQCGVSSVWVVNATVGLLPVWSQ